MRTTLRTCASTIAIIAIPFAAPAFAAEPAPAADAADAPAGEEIVVTAQKRSESVQKVPISIAAFNSAALAKANVTSVDALARVAPNVEISKGIQSSYIKVNVRGIGAASNTTIEPSVAIFLDGVYIPRAGAAVSEMLDIDGVEVLRGPQGTLFGRNASVGAISLKSALPKQELSGRVSGEIGNGQRYKLDGVINAPLGENVAVRIAGLHQWFGGYWHNNADGKRYGGVDDTVLRGTLRADLGKVEWVIRADYSKLTGDGASNVDFDATSVSAAQLAALQARVGGVLPDTNPGDNVMNQSVAANLHDRQWGISSTLSANLDAGTVKLINSYRDWSNSQLDGDVVFTPASILSRLGAFGSKSQNHELQFISPERQWLGGHLDMVAGLYYFEEKYRLSEQFNMGSQFCSVVLPPLNAVLTAQNAACRNYLTATGGQAATNQQVTQSAKSTALYGQATLHLTDTVNLTLGGRYTWDRKSGTYAQVTNPFLATLRAAEALTFPKVSDGRFTYRASLNYQPRPGIMLFANVSTGYKSAGYNSGGGAPALSTFDAGGNLLSTQRVFARETSTNYEIGAKTTWMDGKLTANATLYRMDIGGYQDRAYNSGTASFTVLNVGKLRQQGFEADLIVAPVHGFKLTSSLAYLDSKFLDYANATGLPGAGGTQNLTGKPATFSPKWTGNIAASYSGDIGKTGMSWDLNGNVYFTSQYFAGLVNDANPQTIQKGYALLGARLTINGAHDRWSLAFFGNNLTNKQYTAGNLYQPLDSLLQLRNGVFAGSTAVRLLHADPRTYGTSLTVHF